MDVTVMNRRERLKLFLQMQRPLSRNAVCNKADVSESTIGAFVRGAPSPRYLTDETYDRLSKWSGWTIAELKADAPPPTRDDVLSRKSENGKGTRNDSLTALGHNTVRTEGGSEPEGRMGEELRLEIVNRVWGLPEEFLDGLIKHIETIERARVGRNANPQQRGKTGS
jgi:hypothetical protein